MNKEPIIKQKIFAKKQKLCLISRKDTNNINLLYMLMTYSEAFNDMMLLHSLFFEKSNSIKILICFIYNSKYLIYKN